MIVGGGGHGLATAYYLAKEHGLANVAVVEKGWLGGGNTGRNTTIVRSNYLCEASEAIYAHAHSCGRGLPQELNYNVMFSPRGVMQLAHDRHEEADFKRHIHANRLAGVANEWLTRGAGQGILPAAQHLARGMRYPVRGAALQRTGGTARHDGVVWGYRARGERARRRHHRELRGRPQSAATPPGAVSGVETTRGADRDQEIGVVAAGNISAVMAMAGRAAAARILSAAGSGLRAAEADHFPASSSPTPSTPICRSPTRENW